MRYIAFGMALLMLSVAPALGASRGRVSVLGLYKKVKSVSQQIQAAEKKALEDKVIKELHEKMIEADKKLAALNKAAPQAPRLNAIEEEFNRLRGQMTPLIKEGETLIAGRNRAMGDPERAIMVADANMRIKAIEKKLIELRNQINVIVREGKALLVKRDEALAGPKKAAEEARAALRKALMEQPKIKELYEKRIKLQKQIKEHLSRPPRMRRRRR